MKSEVVITHAVVFFFICANSDLSHVVVSDAKMYKFELNIFMEVTAQVSIEKKEFGLSFHFVLLLAGWSSFATAK